jgi:DNA-binding NarL/FixJ family response regulator
MRRRRTEQRKIINQVRAHETAGDAAMERYAYVEAGAEFEKALEILRNGYNVEDEVRLTEKMAQTLFFGARPDFATPWYERVLQLCENGTRTAENSALAERIPILLGRLMRQAWLECQLPKALELAFRVRDMVDRRANPTLFQQRSLQISGFFVELGRYTEATDYAAGDFVCDRETPLVQSFILSNLAFAKAIQGRAADAFEGFEKAANVAKQIPDGYQVTSIWGDWANAAMALGRLDIARSCRAKALLVAQERRILWRIPFFTLRFAETLIIAGDYEHARDLVSDVLTYDTSTPTIRILRAAVGTELALALNDVSFLRRVFDEEALALAFSSGEPARFGPLAANHARIYIQRREIGRARRLIGEAIAKVQFADYVGDLLALAARYGAPHDAERAREVLIARTKLPHATVAKAFLALWEMNDAIRRRAVTVVSKKREEAIGRFARLGWKHFKNQLQGSELAENVSQASSSSTMFLSDLRYTLSAREQEVAVLVLRGLTNRMIAQTLQITEHTVETHMTSILNRLGLRSRWQLRDLPIEN